MTLSTTNNMRLISVCVCVKWRNQAYIEGSDSSSRVTLNKLNLHSDFPKHVLAL